MISTACLVSGVLTRNQSSVNKVGLVEENKGSPIENAFYGCKFDFYEKGHSHIKRGCGYKIKFPVIDWSGDEIAIAIICCDTGGNIDQNGKQGEDMNLRFPDEEKYRGNKNVEYQQGIAVSCLGKKPSGFQHLVTQGESMRYLTVATWL